MLLCEGTKSAATDPLCHSLAICNWEDSEKWGEGASCGIHTNYSQRTTVLVGMDLTAGDGKAVFSLDGGNEEFQLH